MDEIDRASDAYDRILSSIIAARKPSGPKPCGACHYCGSDLAPGRIFCDAACRDDWQLEQEAKRRNGSR